MRQENPVWLRPDGTDERLVNPTADLIRNFRHYPKDKHQPYRNKAKAIEKKYPKFVQTLLLVQGELDKIDVIERIVSGDTPTKSELAQHDQLVRNKLQQVEQFVVDTYGSVEAFMDWWKK